MIARTLNMQRGVLLALAASIIAVPLISGCSEGSYAENEAADQTSEATVQQADNAPSAETAASVAQAPQDPGAIRILALGDSLTAGYGLDDLSRAFPARLEQELRAAGYAVRILDAGISGDTTAGGRSRLDWSLAENPDAVIVGLGGNDGLRAIDPDVTYDNLKSILSRLEARGIPVLLAGMLAPPNLGREYGERFAGVYQRLSKEHNVVFYPFLLDGVAGEQDLNQDDRIHPNEDGVNVMVERIKPFAEELIDRAQAARQSDTAS